MFTISGFTISEFHCIKVFIINFSNIPTKIKNISLNFQTAANSVKEVAAMRTIKKQQQEDSSYSRSKSSNSSNSSKKRGSL